MGSGGRLASSVGVVRILAQAWHAEWESVVSLPSGSLVQIGQRPGKPGSISEDSGECDDYLLYMII